MLVGAVKAVEVDVEVLCPGSSVESVIKIGLFELVQPELFSLAMTHTCMNWGFGIQTSDKAQK